MQQFIFYSSWLIFPLILGFLVAFFVFKNNLLKTGILVLLIISSIFTYARFVEPQLVVVTQTRISLGFKTKFALISDLDLGVYKTRDYLQKVVDEVNTLDVRFLFIAGGFTYSPEKTDITSLETLFNPLKDIKVPVYGVLGNHDIAKDGDGYRKNLETALKNNKVNLLNNEFLAFQNFTLVGLGENLRNQDDVKILDTFNSEQNIIVLAHNPETVKKYTNNIADITLTGFTHGGQFRIPFLTDYLNRNTADKGLTRINGNKVFVTSGIGETVLPLRLFNPPTIDVLNVE